MTEFEFEWEKTVDRGETAALLRRIADGLEGDGEVELKLDAGKLELDVPDELKLEIEYEAGEEETELEIELSWPTAGAAPQEGAGSDSGEQPGDAGVIEP